MGKLFGIEDKLSNQISLGHILFFVAALPFDRFYSQLALISLAIHTIIHLNKSRLRKLPLKTLLILQSVFWLTLIGMLYSENQSHAGSMLSRQLAIFLFPLLFFSSGLDFRRYLNLILTVFAVVCILTVLYLYIDALRIIWYKALPVSALVSPAFLNHNFSSPIGIHATYLALYIASSIVFLTICLFKPHTKIWKLVTALGLLILYLALIQLGSRTVFITTLVTTCFLFPIICLKKPAKTNYLIASSVAFVILLAGIFQLQTLRSRFFDELLTDLSSKKEVLSKSDPRMERWELALKIAAQSPVVGHGSGDELALLKEKYFQNKLYNSYLFSLNAHNEYLSFLIKHGAVGLLIFLMTLMWGLFKAIRRNDVYFISFFLQLIMLSFSENFLDVNKGIFFYAFFFALFAVVHSAPKPVEPRQQGFF
jgi:O-antigen ligase